MAKIDATMSISLDGVIQPGPQRRGHSDGFDRGGWAVPYGDEVMMQKMGEGMSGDSAMLFGRRTYSTSPATGPIRPTIRSPPTSTRCRSTWCPAP